MKSIFNPNEAMTTTSKNAISTTATMEETLKSYVNFASRSEDLKSEESSLSAVLGNLKTIKSIVIEKENEFCIQDQCLRASSAWPPLSSGYQQLVRVSTFNADNNNNNNPSDTQLSHNHVLLSVKDSLRKRCFNLIDHLVHYKCVLECLSTEVLSPTSNFIDDDEYIHLCLMIRDVEVTIRKAIKLNQQRNEDFLYMHDEEARAVLAEVEHKWRTEHHERRQLMNKLILDQSQFIVDKTTRNLEQQQALLNQRYQSINSLIRMSYKHFDAGNDNNNQL